MSEIDNLRKIINDRADAWINETEDDTDALRAEVDRLNAYAIKLLSDRKSTRLNSSHRSLSRMPSSA